MRRPWWYLPARDDGDDDDNLNTRSETHTVAVPHTVEPGPTGPVERGQVWCRPEAADHWNDTLWRTHP